MNTLKRSVCKNSVSLVALAALMLLAVLATQNVSVAGTPLASGEVIIVSTTIQAAVDQAEPGDTVLAPPGIYRENVRVTKDNITIQGDQNAVLDGTGLTGNTGIRVAPADPTNRINGFTLSGLTIRNYTRNGVFLSRVDNFRISDGTYIDNDEYGIFPVLSSDGLIAFNDVSGSDDTGIYVGQSRDVVIKKNHTRDCTIGIEIENSSQINVRKNKVKGNSIGIVVQLLPGRGVPVTSDVSVTGNRIVANNRPNPVTDPDEFLSQLPSGIGFINVAGDRVNVNGNFANRNNSAGIVVAQLPPAIAALDPRINPFPDNNEIRDNEAFENGDDPDPKLSPFPGRDLLWDFSGTGNCWAGNAFKTFFPALPACP